jgi:hypothetical protein
MLRGGSDIERASFISIMVNETFTRVVVPTHKGRLLGTGGA